MKHGRLGDSVTCPVADAFSWVVEPKHLLSPLLSLLELALAAASVTKHSAVDRGT